MKILIDLTSLADNFSGIERYAACLTREMISECKHNYILVFKNQVHPMFEKYNVYANIKIVVIPGCNKVWFNQVRLPIEIYKYKADCYLFMAFPIPVLLFRKNMISTIHDICCWDCPETMNGLSDWYFRISHYVALKKCKRIITISKFSKERIITRLKYPEEKIWLIYCGIDEKFVSYHRTGENDLAVRKKYSLPDKYILSLSTLEPRKNTELLVKTYSELVEENRVSYPLVLAGRKGWKMDNLLSGISNIAKEKILFTGFIDDEDLPAVYANANLFVFPSRYEGFGMPPLEAMACGTRVLSSDASSLPEVLGDTANYFENQNKDDFKEKILLCINESNVNEMKHKSDYVNQVKMFDWKVEAVKLLEKIEEVVN